jgi:hypothetical protein
MNGMSRYSTMNSNKATFWLLDDKDDEMADREEGELPVSPKSPPLLFEDDQKNFPYYYFSTLPDMDFWDEMNNSPMEILTCRDFFPLPKGFVVASSVEETI